MRAGDLQLSRLLLQLAKQARVVDGHGRLARERLHQVDGALGEPAGYAPANHQCSDDVVLAQQRDGQHRAPPGPPHLVDVGIRRLKLKVGRLTRLAGRGGAADERLVQMDPRRPQRLDQRTAGAVERPHVELLGLVVELEDRAPFGSGQLDRPRHDGREHLLQVDAGADRLAGLTQRLQLAHRLRELAAAILQLHEQLHVLDRDRALLREGRDQRDRAIIERLDLAPGEDDHADHLLGDQHRDAQDRTQLTQGEGLLPLVARVGAGILDLHGALLDADQPDHRARPASDRVFLQQSPVLGRGAGGAREPVEVTLELPNLPRVGSAQPHGMLHHRLEHRLQLERGATHHLDHIAGRGLVLDRFREIAREPLEIVWRRRFGPSGHLATGSPSYLTASVEEL